MKAKIEFEIPDTKDSEETKQLLIAEIANVVQDWLDGKGIINIEFNTTYENTKTDVYTGWISDTTIN
jgi:hypothetical protein|tara:strand:- start:1371 stop:1571 length:201 start_codon:yes stop_codon:yes gene_type:complete